MAAPQIRIIDVTNRDAAQSARRNFSKLQKTMINNYLAVMGVYQSEFGFPTVTHEAHYLRANLALKNSGGLGSLVLSGWIRAIPEDVEAALCILPDIEHLNISMSTSDSMIKAKWQGRKTFEDILTNMLDALALAKQKGVQTVGVNAEDASGTEMARLIEFANKAKEKGADRLRYCDTLGRDNPAGVIKKMETLVRESLMDIELHFHNDLGMAVANTVAATMAVIDSGMDAYPNTTINGLGERAGNADLISVMLALRYGFDKNWLPTGMDLSQSWNVANYVAKATDVPIAFNQPGVGPEMFAVSSGIHADAMLKDTRSYELYDHLAVGRGEPELVETGRQILMGDYIGTKGFRDVCGRLGVVLPEDEKTVQHLWDLARFANVHNHRMLTADEMRFIVGYPNIVTEILKMEP